MSLMGTLAKVAIGVAVAKGVKSMSSGGGLLGGASSSGGGGLQDMMGSLLGGTSGKTSAGAAGGLGGLLEQLTGSQTSTRKRSTSTSGGLGGLLGQLTGGAGASSGGLGGLLNQLGGSSSGGLGGILGGLATAGAAGGLGSLLAGEKSFGATLNSSFTNRGEPDVTPTASQEAVAGLMILAMVQAAKSDGTVDTAEQEKLLGNLGDVSAQEAAFVQAALDAPLDVNALAQQVPNGLEAQVYTMSLMAIDLDNQQEAQYLHSLATALEMEQKDVNHIHAELGAPALYA